MENIKLVEIDKNNQEDCQLISEIIKTYYPKSPYPPSPQEISESYIVYFKAFVDQELIGISGIKKVSPFLAETVKTIVFSEKRGRGLGKVLSQEIENECVRRKFHKIMTGIYTFNLPMLNIKLKQGYTIEGFHKDHDMPGLDEYTLGKIIGASDLSKKS